MRRRADTTEARSGPERAARWAPRHRTAPRVMNQPAGAYGDSMGGMTIAGGIAAALFARDRTGEPSVVDVSLLSVGVWAMALSVSNALMTGEAPPGIPMDGAGASPVQPDYRQLSDGRRSMDQSDHAPSPAGTGLMCVVISTCPN